MLAVGVGALSPIDQEAPVVQCRNVRKQPVRGGTGEGRRESRNNGPGEVGNDFWPWERKTEWWPCQDQNSGMKVLMVSSTR